MKKTMLHEKVYYYEDAIDNFDEVIHTISELAKDNSPEGIDLWQEWTASDDKDTIYGETQNFDLALMDMVMPEMDGIEATQRLRQELQGEAALVPVMGLTANVNPNDLERFAKAGVDDTVLKPFEQDKLCTQVQHLLNKKKSSQGS